MLNKNNTLTFLIYLNSLDFQKDLLKKSFTPISINGQDHKDLIDRIRKRKCFADKDLEEIPDQQKQQTSSEFFEEQSTSSLSTSHNYSAFHEPNRINNTIFDYSNCLGNNNSIPSPNSIMQYYSMIFTYLMNIQPPTMDLSYSGTIDRNERDYRSDSIITNKILSKVTNFSVDALLNTT